MLIFVRRHPGAAGFRSQDKDRRAMTIDRQETGRYVNPYSDFGFKWLFALKNMTRLLDRPAELQHHVFERLFRTAEVAKMKGARLPVQQIRATTSISTYEIEKA